MNTSHPCICEEHTGWKFLVWLFYLRLDHRGAYHKRDTLVILSVSKFRDHQDHRIICREPLSLVGEIHLIDFNLKVMTIAFEWPSNFRAHIDSVLRNSHPAW